MAAQQDCEVEVEWLAEGDILEVLAEYADYMRREMPHINRLRNVEISKIVAVIERLDVKEINKLWRFEFLDVQRWGGHDDDVYRALVASDCRGDDWRTLTRHINAKIPTVETYHSEDVALYAFIKFIVAVEAEIKYNEVFALGNMNNKVRIVLDSCCFDPSVNGGDLLHLDAEHIAQRALRVRQVFPNNSLKIVCKGGYETSIGNDMSEDEEGESIEDGELESSSDSEDDEYESDFVVSDDVCD